MSTFLGFESYLIPLGSTQQNVQDTFRTALSSYGWQVLRQNVLPVAILGTLPNPGNALDLTPNAAGNNTALPLWVGCQVTTAFTPTVMYLQAYSDSTYEASLCAPLNFTLDWSDNGSSWTTHQTWTGEALWTCWEKRKYTITGAPAKNYWRLNITARQSGGTYTYINAWTLEDSSKNWITSTPFIDVIPPVTETIGNSVAKEYIRFVFNASNISIMAQQELLTDLPPIYAFDTPTAGAVTLSVTINGVTVSYSGIAANSAGQNARGLFEACAGSTDPNFTAWNWYWEPWAGYVGGLIIRAVKKVASMPPVITATNITRRMRGHYVQAQSQHTGISSNNVYTVSTDLTNGFIYYLQVNARGLALATKTNVGYSTPVHMCYGDNASAIAQTPVGTIKEIPCTPIELILGTDEVTTNSGATGKTSHVWGVSSGLGSWTNGRDGGQVDNYFLSYTYPYSSNMWNCQFITTFLQDYSTGHTVSGYGLAAGENTIYLYGGGLFEGGDSGTTFNIHRMSLKQQVGWNYSRYSDANARWTVPAYDSLDWYKIYGTITDEQLLFAPSSDFTTYITSPVVPTDVTINVNSTTGFPSVGYIVIDSEAIQYTGLTSTSFTGCTRAKYATTAATYQNNSSVYVGIWLVKIQNGLLLAGYTKPV